MGRVATSLRLLPDWDSSAEVTPSMQKFSAAAFEALTAEECDHILASVREGARFRVFCWSGFRQSRHVLSQYDGDLCDGDLYLAEPSEWLVAQRLGSSLRSTITIVLWCALVGILSLPLLLALPFWVMSIVHIVRLLAVNVPGGRDVTDAALYQLRRKLHDFAEAEDTRDFFDDLSQRPPPISGSSGNPL